MEENYNLAKWLAGDKKAAATEELQNEADFAIYSKIKKYSATLETPDFDEQKLLSSILNTPKKPSKTIPLYHRKFARIAALLVLCLGLYFNFNYFSTVTEFSENGKQVAYSLPDNSKVILNSSSKLEFNQWNWNKNRKLNLEGEAYFKVAKGKTFEVVTPIGTVTVLGTQFNVKQRNNRFEVTCYEGKVKVNYKNKELLLTKGLSAAFDADNNIIIPEKTIAKPEWLDHEMVFYQENITTILQEFERQFDVKIKITSFDHTRLFTGTIPTNNVKKALDLLSITYHLKWTNTGSDTYILKPIHAEK